MTGRKLLLLLGFTEDDTKMASVRWRRFKRHLSPSNFSFEWAPVKLPFCDGPSGMTAKAMRELKVLRHAKRLSRYLARNQEVAVRTTIVASIPTLDPLYVGVMLRRARRRDTELVLEVRDVYARPELYEYNATRRRLEVFKESLLIRYVDRFIFLTDEIKRRYGIYYPDLQGIREGAVITNGYDPAEYGTCAATPVRPRQLEIGYFGSFYATRNPELLFQTLRLLRTSDPEAAARIRIRIWGEPGNYPLQTKIAEHGLQNMVVYQGTGSHEDIIKEYTGTAVNLIITHRVGSSYALPGKLFEYIGAARPIWAITEDRILRDFIARHKLGYLSSHSTRSIGETLRTLVRDHARAGGLPSISRLEDYEVGALTRRLESFLMDGTAAGKDGWTRSRMRVFAR